VCQIPTIAPYKPEVRGRGYALIGALLAIPQFFFLSIFFSPGLALAYHPSTKIKSTCYTTKVFSTPATQLLNWEIL